MDLLVCQKPALLGPALMQNESAASQGQYNRVLHVGEAYSSAK